MHAGSRCRSTVTDVATLVGLTRIAAERPLREWRDRGV